MKYQKLILRAAIVLVLLGVAWGISVQAQAGQNFAQPTPTSNQDIVSYLESQLNQQKVPFTKIVVVQDFPLQIEVNIQSMSEDKDWMPEDFENLLLARREAILAAEKGFNIERYTEVLINKNGEPISWARIKINGEILYSKPLPSNVADSVTKNLVSEKINTYGISVINSEISSFDGLQTLNLDLSANSLEEANQVLSQVRDSLRPLTKDINSQGAQIVMVKLEVKSEKGDILLNYLLDLQFGTEGWWAADGINVDSWYPSIPESAP
jgi:hypothetical protein